MPSTSTASGVKVGSSAVCTVTPSTEEALVPGEGQLRVRVRVRVRVRGRVRVRARVGVGSGSAGASAHVGVVAHTRVRSAPMAWASGAPRPATWILAMRPKLAGSISSISISPSWSSTPGASRTSTRADSKLARAKPPSLPAAVRRNATRPEPAAGWKAQRGEPGEG